MPNDWLGVEDRPGWKRLVDEAERLTSSEWVAKPEAQALKRVEVVNGRLQLAFGEPPGDGAARATGIAAGRPRAERRDLRAMRRQGRPSRRPAGATDRKPLRSVPHAADRAGEAGVGSVRRTGRASGLAGPVDRRHTRRHERRRLGTRPTRPTTDGWRHSTPNRSRA